MPDPVGGREAETEAVARALHFRYDDSSPQDRARWNAEAEAAIVALDAARSSGSAAQNQEEALSIHVDVCPDCGEPTSYHPMDPPMQCTHDRERYVPVRFIEARPPQDEDHS
jgi:hypothetical protein